MDEQKPVEETEEQKTAKRLEGFLQHTKTMLDKYFDHLGYVCFVFNKNKHKGESVYISNSPEDVPSIVEPYANAKTLEEARQRKIKLREMRRVK